MDGPIVPWDQGAHNAYGWVLFITFLSFGTFANLVQIFLLRASPEIKALRGNVLVTYLAVSDFLFNFLCLIDCIYNLSVGSYADEQNHCNWQATWIVYTACFSGQTMVLIAHESKRAFGHGRPMTNAQIHKLHAIFALTSLVMTLVLVLPSLPELNHSGLYCTPGWSKAESFGVFFGIAIGGLAISTGYNYSVMFARIRRMKRKLTARNSDLSPRQKEFYNATRLVLYLMVFIGSWGGLLVVNVYQFASKTPASIPLHLAVGILAHVNAAVDPLLFFWTNVDARRALRRYLGLEPNFKLSEADGAAESGLAKVLNDTQKSKYFRRFLQKEHCTENLDFYRDCQKRDNLLDELEARDMSTRERWSRAKEITAEVMELYVERSAPLQVNLSSQVRDECLRSFASLRERRCSSSHTSSMLSTDTRAWEEMRAFLKPARSEIYLLMTFDCLPRFLVVYERVQAEMASREVSLSASMTVPKHEYKEAPLWFKFLQFVCPCAPCLVRSTISQDEINYLKNANFSRHESEKGNEVCIAMNSKGNGLALQAADSPKAADDNESKISGVLSAEPLSDTATPLDSPRSVSCAASTSTPITITTADSPRSTLDSAGADSAPSISCTMPTPHEAGSSPRSSTGTLRSVTVPGAAADSSSSLIPQTPDSSTSRAKTGIAYVVSKATHT